MTVLVEGANSYYLGTQALLLDDDREIASSWASSHIVSNPAIKWVLGKYVEADNANYNGQYWSLADLQMKSPTIIHSPMNMNHQQKKIVGTFVAAEMMYPRAAEDEAQQAHPYIETLGAFWKYYFPDELDVVEAAFHSGECFLSMECVSASITCGGESGCGQTFPYDGPRSASYCEHLLGPNAVKQLNDPHFLAGALIIPPAQPGWGGAEVKELSKLMAEQVEAANRIDQEIATEMPDLDWKKREQIVLQLLRNATEEQANKTPADIIARRIVRDSIKP